MLKGRLIVAPFAYGVSPSSIIVGDNAIFLVENDFVIGDDVRIIINNNGQLNCVGKKKSSGSGITCQAKILVGRFVKIGGDVIISWGTFITDSDHHPINGKLIMEDTIISEHVWLAAGVQVLKGSHIGSDSIVAANAVVLKGVYPNQSLLAGTPAKVKGDAPEWSRD
ncbi:MAG: hypothetical protein R8M45_10835 [Ghiorsea sp.]